MSIKYNYHLMYVAVNVCCHRELNDEVDLFNNQSAMYLTPVINIKGSCHAQFASGPMPAEVRRYDLQPDISDDDAHKMMGGHMTSFISTVFNIGNVTEAKQNLSHAYDDTGDRMSVMQCCYYIID